MIELERTFLLKALPQEIEGVRPTRIRDIYIPEGVAHAHLRLRQKGEQYEMTKKTLLSSEDASSQREETIELSREEFLALAKCSKREVVKDRYRVPVAERTAEVDVFLGDLAGLVLCDFEFETEAEKLGFFLPDFVLADVTQEEFIAGGYLAGKKYADIEPGLQGYGYKKMPARALDLTKH